LKTKPLPLGVYRKIYSRVPRLCVDLVIKSEGGIVLVKRDIPPKQGYWHLPGGTVRFGESLREAVSRVALDETGLRVRIENELQVIEYSKESAFGWTISVAFTAIRLSGRLRGNRYGRDVGVFNQLPTPLIREQESVCLAVLHQPGA